jgi:hypothetical protein
MLVIVTSLAERGDFISAFNLEQESANILEWSMRLKLISDVANGLRLLQLTLYICIAL